MKHGLRYTDLYLSNTSNVDVIKCDTIEELKDELNGLFNIGQINFLILKTELANKNKNNIDYMRLVIEHPNFTSGRCMLFGKILAISVNILPYKIQKFFRVFSNESNEQIKNPRDPIVINWLKTLDDDFSLLIANENGANYYY